MKTILLLTISNVFMTFAWYGHLKYKSSPLWIVILASWGIAFFEYVFQVPANRMGHGQFNAAQLKTIQEIITLITFSVFSVLYLREEFKWNYAVGFIFIVLAAFLYSGTGRGIGHTIVIQWSYSCHTIVFKQLYDHRLTTV
jgi:uncharacterized protein